MLACTLPMATECTMVPRYTQAVPGDANMAAIFGMIRVQSRYSESSAIRKCEAAV